MNCLWCQSKIYETDRICPRCGAPNKSVIDKVQCIPQQTMEQFINQIENTKPQINLENKKSQITSIYAVPDPIYLNKNHKSHKIQVLAHKNFQYSPFDITKQCKFSKLSSNNNFYTVDNNGEVKLNNNAQENDYGILKIEYYDRENNNNFSDNINIKYY